MLSPVQQGDELGCVVPVLANDERESLEHRLEPLVGVLGAIPDGREVLEMAGDLALVPGREDCFDVREVLVWERSA